MVRNFDQLLSHNANDHILELSPKVVFLQVGTLHPRVVCAELFPPIPEAGTDAQAQPPFLSHYLPFVFLYPVLEFRKVLKGEALPKSKLKDSEFSLWPDLLFSCNSQD